MFWFSAPDSGSPERGRASIMPAFLPQPLGPDSSPGSRWFGDTRVATRW